MAKFYKQWMIFIAVILLLTASMPSVFAQSQPTANDAGSQHVYLPLVNANTATGAWTNQMIIRYHADVQAASADRVAQVAAFSQTAGVTLKYQRELAPDVLVVRLPENMNLTTVNAIAAQLMTREDVAFAEPDAIMQPRLTPNDAYYPNQWHYAAPTTGNYGANLPAAWDITIGSPSIVAAVVDTGILNHADLAGRTVPGYDFIGDTAISNDGNGRDNNPSDPGDWVTSAESSSGALAGCPVSNSSWHGTHVAGTIGANSNNGVGVAGINWQSKILPVRVLGKCGGYTSDIADGIRWAAGLAVSGVPANANPAKVINISLGGSGQCVAGSTFQLAINDAVNAGAVVVAAAGNSNADALNFSPASCANVITVAATGRTGNRAYYSNYGSTVEISAPGGDMSTGSSNGVLSTLNTGTTTPASDTYAYYQGTSMATPHVTGIVSLMFSRNPNLTPAQVTQILQSTITPFPAGSTCTTAICGAGIINAAAAVNASDPALTTLPSAFSKSSPNTLGKVSSTTPTLSWATSSAATGYQYCIDTTNNNTCDSSWISTGTATTAALSGLVNNTTYYWQVRATNNVGATDANSGTWWSFSVQLPTAPAAFNKTSPSNGKTNQSASGITLQWGASSGATGYEVCRDTVNNNSCDTSWVAVGNVTQVGSGSLTSRTTYYWQVRAVNSAGTTNANSGAWWSFSTK